MDGWNSWNDGKMVLKEEDCREKESEREREQATNDDWTDLNGCRKT